MGQAEWSGSASTSSSFVTPKCSRLFPLQPTHKYSQHQGFFSTSHWRTAPSPISSRAAAKATSSEVDILNAACLPCRPARAGGVEMTSRSPGAAPQQLSWGCAGVQGHHAAAEQESHHICFRMSDGSKIQMDKSGHQAFAFSDCNPFLWTRMFTWPIQRSLCCKRVSWEYLNWIWITIWRRPFIEL